MTHKTDLDVLIIGAGISGIGTAYWLQKKCPQKSFAILEAREQIGGTWSLFKYPGIRSDSDMFTFGYRFKPWSNPKSLSSGADILHYLEETVAENDLQQHIRFSHRMLSANWSSSDECWYVNAQTPEGEQTLSCNFICNCTGYYNYHEAHTPRFTGQEDFTGPIVIPQFWPEELDYTGKNVLVIGSGATAMTLVPALAARGAGHVTMLQRSPTYVVNLPNRNVTFTRLKRILPMRWAYRLARAQNILMQMASFKLSKAFPDWMRNYIKKEAAKQLPEDFDVDKHFNPSYLPWDERLCVVPDGDLFASIRNGQASVVTDTIDRFLPQGVRISSGQTLQADIIVLATGLKMQLLGGATVSLDGQPRGINETMIYKGMMASNIPNFIYTFGYTNNAWTLKADLTANYLCKLLNYMDQNKYKVVTPIGEASNSTESVLNLDSGYIKRAAHILPKQGDQRPWRVYQDYLLDMLTTRYGRISDRVLKFS